MIRQDIFGGVYYGERWANEVDLSTLKDEIIEDSLISNAELFVKFESGRVIYAYHDQDCCESTELLESNELPQEKVFDIQIDIHRLDSSDHQTYTRFTFYTHDKTHEKYWFTLNRTSFLWCVSSNGYYSESISVVELKKDE